MISIRRASADDWAVYRELRLRALTLAPDAYGSTLADEGERVESWWRERVAGAHTLMAWDGERGVGTAVAIPDPHEASCREIVAVWIEPDARAAGVGRALIEAHVDAAREAGVPAVSLWVSDGNEVATRLYARCGFEATGERDLVRGDLHESRMRRLT